MGLELGSGGEGALNHVGGACNSDTVLLGEIVFLPQEFLPSFFTSAYFTH